MIMIFLMLMMITIFLVMMLLPPSEDSDEVAPEVAQIYYLREQIENTM